MTPARLVVNLVLTLALCAPARAAGAPAAPAASLAAGPGRVRVGGVELKIGAPVATGDELSVVGGDAVVAFSDGTKIRLAAGSTLRVTDKSSRQTSLHLLKGKIDAWVKLSLGRRFRIRAGTAVASVRGTILSGTPTGFSLFQGALSVTDDVGRTILLNGLQFVNLTSGGLGNSGSLPPNTVVPVEPPVSLPPPAGPPPGGGKKKAKNTGEVPPESLPAEETAATSGSPTQETNSSVTKCASTVSPSSPCP